MNGDIKNAFLELAKRDYDAAKKILLSFGVDRFGDLTQSQVNAVGVLLSAPLLSEIAPELEIRQAAVRAVRPDRRRQPIEALDAHGVAAS